MCRLGQVSRAGFYRHWQQKEPRMEQMEFRAQMQESGACSAACRDRRRWACAAAVFSSPPPRTDSASPRPLWRLL